MMIITLAGCAGGSSSPSRSTSEPEQVPLVIESTQRSASDWLTEAKAARTNEDRQHALILAAAAYQNQQQWQHAAAVLSQVQESQLSAADRRQFRLLQAEFAAQQQNWPEVLNLLDNLTNQFTERTERAKVLYLRAAAATVEGEFLEAALWRIEQQRYQPDGVSSADIWALLQRVSWQDWQNFQRPSETLVDGWTRLAIRLQDALRNQDDITATLQQWQASYPDHPAQEILRSTFSDWLEPHDQSREVVVLLPLSGQYASQGLAIRDGIIMALLAQPSLSTTFIDTNTTASDTIIERLQTLQPDFVVGPLLKENVDTMLANREALVWPQLFLNEQPVMTAGNLDDETAAPAAEKQPGHYFFALDPETEVRSAADYLFHSGYQQPLVFAPETTRGQQAVKVFSNHWAKLPARNPDINAGFYRTTEDMKNSVQLNLGVQDSEQRINTVKIAAGKIIVDAEPRSRTDVDAIYLTAGADQTRLLKPFIEVNTSPFAKRIPVYASSASHLRQSSVSENDLHQVRFSEMPWLLPNHEDAELLTELFEVRNQWGLSQARLAAMGHDAMQLVPSLPIMEHLPGYQHIGYTGLLNVNGKRLQRQLSWASFNQHQVQPVKGDDYVPTPVWSGL